MTEHRESTEIDLRHLGQWVDKEFVTLTETLDLRPAAGLAALLNRSTAPCLGDALPPLWHWVYFTPSPKTSELGCDGHPLRGSFLPPVPLQRRMWAAGETHFHAPLFLGETVEKRSRVSAVELKQGASGPLIFVDVTHEYRVAGELRISEVQTLVYMDKPGSGQSKQSTEACAPFGVWNRSIQPNSVLLFRYSALTSNSHRIHYDRDYAVNEEGYPGLVVQAPLAATLLAELLAENLSARRMAGFRFRAMHALEAGPAFTIHGAVEANDSVALWALAADGRLALKASARLA